MDLRKFREHFLNAARDAGYTLSCGDDDGDDVEDGTFSGETLLEALEQKVITLDELAAKFIGGIRENFHLSNL